MICTSCGLTFGSVSEQKQHYRSSWHSCNLKRKVAGLVPFSKEAYESQILPEKREKTKCPHCLVEFSSLKGLHNHLRSGRHGLLEESEDELVGWRRELRQCVDQGDDLEANRLWKLIKQASGPVNPKRCLFCNSEYETLDENISHMVDRHSFHIPHRERLADPEGLIEFLAEKVFCACICIYCDAQSRQYHSVSGVQQHMVDKGHTMIKADDCKELPFYTWSKSGDLIESEDHELVLPSGTKIGHREYWIYYRQNPGVVQAFETELIDSGEMHRGSGLWTRQDVRSQRMHQLSTEKIRMKLGVKHSKFQPHYREQIL